MLVKEEIEHLLKAKCIQVARYMELVSNFVPIKKKTGKIRVCYDYYDLNLASPKDEYVMSLADQLIASH